MKTRTEGKVEDILFLLELGFSPASIERRLNVHHEDVVLIAKKKGITVAAPKIKYLKTLYSEDLGIRVIPTPPHVERESFFELKSGHRERLNKIKAERQRLYVLGKGD